MKLVTKKCYDMMIEKASNLRYIEQPAASKMVEESRPYGTFEDNPDYLHAMDNLEKVNRELFKLQNNINDSIIFTKEMAKNDSVSFGTTVSFKNIESNAEKTYTIVSIYESNIEEGLISIESPLVKSMLNLKVGDYFDFNDNSYEITSILISSQLFS